MSTLTLQSYSAKALRATGGAVFITSSKGYIGLYRPTSDPILSPTERAILAWALGHPGTRHCDGWLRLSATTFALLDGVGGFTIYSRVPEAV